MDIREYLKTGKLVCDGAFGTYFSVNDELLMPEKANVLKSEEVTKIHCEYIIAGARLIRTNTFASNKVSLECNDEQLRENIAAAFKAARLAVSQTVGEGNCFVAGDIGPIQNESEDDYISIADIMLENKAEIIVFETFADVEVLVPAIKHIASKAPNTFIIVQFCFNQHGFTQRGISAKSLVQRCKEIDEISAFGFNCGIGPEHLKNIIKKTDLNTDKYITALPNSSYPTVIKNRMVYAENADYFCDVMQSVTEYVDIIGGCCGTTPSYIKKLCEYVSLKAGRKSTDGVAPDVLASGSECKSAFFEGKKEGEKLIAVELDPPKDGDCTTLMETANFLKQHSVDVITFADSPSGRTRADSVLMSTKVKREVGIEVMPHICCRDKNAIGMSSLMLGAYINGIRNMLVITGDPVPSTSRGDIKGVFNFDSVKLMEYISKINEENFPGDKICYGGAINYARKNIEVEVNRALKKEAAGAKFFLTQPVYCDEDIEKLRYIKSKLKAKVLVGIMPLVSYNNATFIKNEIAGINVPDEVVMQYSREMTREEGRAKGIEISAEIMKKTQDFDGYYLTIPFNRLSTAKALLELVEDMG